jgi:hypothetical protein
MTHSILTATQHRHRRIRGIAGLLVTTALLGVVACSGSDSSTGPRNNDNNASPAGTYALFQVDGKNIPKQIFRGPMTLPGGATYDDFTFTITGGELILQKGGDIHAAIDYKASGGGNEATGTSVADGTYEIDGDQIYISSEGGGNGGSFRNGVITLKLDLMGKGDARTYTFRFVP